MNLYNFEVAQRAKEDLSTFAQSQMIKIEKYPVHQMNSALHRPDYLNAIKQTSQITEEQRFL
jgi:hypothetical protein